MQQVTAQMMERLRQSVGFDQIDLKLRGAIKSGDTRFYHAAVKAVQHTREHQQWKRERSRKKSQRSAANKAARAAANRARAKGIRK